MFLRAHTMLLLAAVILGCESPDDPMSHDACGGWEPMAATPGMFCAQPSDCGIPSVCVMAECIHNQCVYSSAEVGQLCIECGVRGVCNGASICDSVATDVPTGACDDGDQCTTDDFDASISSCVHEQRANGSKCASGQKIGYCKSGFCVVPSSGAEEAVCDNPPTECEGTGAYIVNKLDGSCFSEWCNLGESGRTILRKPAGSPCFRAKEPGSPEFAQGQCSPCGTCL